MKQNNRDNAESIYSESPASTSTYYANSVNRESTAPVFINNRGEGHLTSSDSVSDIASSYQSKITMLSNQEAQPFHFSDKESSYSYNSFGSSSKPPNLDGYKIPES